MTGAPCAHRGMHLGSQCLQARCSSSKYRPSLPCWACWGIEIATSLSCCSVSGLRVQGSGLGQPVATTYSSSPDQNQEVAFKGLSESSSLRKLPQVPAGSTPLFLLSPNVSWSGNSGYWRDGCASILKNRQNFNKSICLPWSPAIPPLETHQVKWKPVSTQTTQPWMFIVVLFAYIPKWKMIQCATSKSIRKLWYIQSQNTIL